MSGAPTQGNTLPSVAPPGAVCAKCLHGVRGLGRGTPCPECGTPVDKSADAGWWGNAPHRLLRRAAVFSLVLAISAAALAGLGILLAVQIARSLAGMFGGTATPTDRLLTAVLPLATLAAVTAVTIGVIGAARSLTASGLCRRPMARTAAAGMVLVVLVWGLSVGRETFNLPSPPDQLMAFAFTLGGTVGLLAWSIVQHTAIAQLTGGVRRALAWAQAAASIVLMVASFAVLVENYGRQSVRDAMISPLIEAIADRLPYAVLAAVCVTAVNALALSFALRRFARARAAA